MPDSQKRHLEDGQTSNFAECEQEYKAVAVILFCTFVLVTFFIVGMLTSIYVIIAGLVIVRVCTVRLPTRS